MEADITNPAAAELLTADTPILAAFISAAKLVKVYPTLVPVVKKNKFEDDSST